MPEGDFDEVIRFLVEQVEQELGHPMYSDRMSRRLRNAVAGSADRGADLVLSHTLPDGTERQLVFQVKQFTQWAVQLGLVTERRVSDWSEPVQATTLAAAPDWRSDWLRARALLLAALYFTLSVSAEEIWPDQVANLRDNMLAATAIYGAYVLWEKRRKDR